MRVSFVLRSAEAYLIAQCNYSQRTIGNLKSFAGKPWKLKLTKLTIGNITIGNLESRTYYRELTIRELTIGNLLSGTYYRELKGYNWKAVNSVAFPGGPPAQYYPGLASLSYGVRMGSSVFNAVWSTAGILSISVSTVRRNLVPDSWNATIGNLIVLDLLDSE